MKGSFRASLVEIAFQHYLYFDTKVAHLNNQTQERLEEFYLYRVVYFNRLSVIYIDIVTHFLEGSYYAFPFLPPPIALYICYASKF